MHSKYIYFHSKLSNNIQFPLVAVAESTTMLGRIMKGLLFGGSGVAHQLGMDAIRIYIYIVARESRVLRD